VRTRVHTRVRGRHNFDHWWKFINADPHKGPTTKAGKVVEGLSNTYEMMLEIRGHKGLKVDGLANHEGEKRWGGDG